MVQLSEHKGDDWEKLANEYTKITHDTSLAPIGLMLERANALSPFSQATAILDNGCGPGPVMTRIIKDYGPIIPPDCPLTCSDFSEAMIKQVVASKEKAEKGSPWTRVQTKVQNAMNLEEIANDSQSHMTAGMVYFMTPDPQQCLKESKRVLKPDGVLSLSSWEDSQWMQLMATINKVRPDKQLPSIPEEWRSTSGVEGELKKAGFKDVEAHRCPVEMAFESHESIAEFFITKLPHMVMMTKDMSSDEVAKVKEVMVADMKEMCADAPGRLNGVAIVAIGRK